MSSNHQYTSNDSATCAKASSPARGIAHGFSEKRYNRRNDASNAQISDGSFPTKNTVSATSRPRDIQKENVCDEVSFTDSNSATKESSTFEKKPTRVSEFRSPLMASPIPNNDDTRDNFSSNEISFPSNTDEINECLFSPDLSNNIGTPTSLFNENGDSLQLVNDDEDIQDEEVEEEETLEQRLLREQEESEALARHLMAEEAIASYNMSADFLRNNPENYSEEDLAALEAAMAEEDPSELSYETMLRLGERMGDVKLERWAMVAEQHIRKLSMLVYDSSMADGKSENDSTVKCLVCQCSYEGGDYLRKLPCNHCFHVDCVDQWLSSKDICPYCRQSIQE